MTLTKPKSGSGKSKGSDNSRNWKPIQNTNYVDSKASYNMPTISSRVTNGNDRDHIERPTAIRTTIDVNVTYKHQPGFGPEEAQDQAHLLSR